ncbi:MAG: succinate dehydrogenase, hydrophobic membrane anchor protein [Alphaproteobacteria bacterium]|nr:succinate dehydrogenase, hydrophobic membrane anchor protein [Alphaproteobacteria bacterium]
MAGKKTKSKYIAPLKKAKGLGSAHEGVDHWMAQKITAIINAPIILWFVFSMINNIGKSHAEFTAWVAHPIHTILLLVMVSSVLYHAKLGAQVITEDYVSRKCLKLFKLIAQKIFFFVLGVACVYSILKIAFMAGI